MININNFYELYNEWFNNNIFWFRKIERYDVYISDKYFKYLQDTDYIFMNYKFDKKLLISCIILLDQIPRHHKRVYDNNILVDIYSKKAIKFSELIINNFDNLTIDELSFIYLPYRHINDIENIHKIINIFINLYNNSFNKDKLKCKKYLYHTLNNIYKLINLKNYDNKIIVKKFNDINKKIFDLNSLKQYESCFKNEDSNIYITINNELLKLKNNSTIIVSLSGGVDSIVALFILNLLSKKNNNKIKNIIAIHINYNNRIYSNDELDFVNYFCNTLNIKFIYRNITEIKREQCMNNGLRNLYEDITKKIRYDMYNYGYLYSNNFYVLLGHNSNDCFENIITNIINKNNYDNLSGMENIINIDNIFFWRPMLNISKKNIISFANNNNLPYLNDSTPHWSARGKIRDNLVPFLNNLKYNSIESFFDLKNYINNSNKIIKNIIINNLISKLIYNNNINNIYAYYNYNELDCFRYINIGILFFNEINIYSSFKSFKEFSNYIDKFLFNFKSNKFILNKKINIIIYKHKNNFKFNINYLL